MLSITGSPKIRRSSLISQRQEMVTYFWAVLCIVMYYYFKQQNVTYKVDVLIADVYSRVNFESLQICPHFTDFEFTNWTRNREVLSLIPTCIFCSLKFAALALIHLLSFKAVFLHLMSRLPPSIFNWLPAVSSIFQHFYFNRLYCHSNVR